MRRTSLSLIYRYYLSDTQMKDSLAVLYVFRISLCLSHVSFYVSPNRGNICPGAIYSEVKSQ